MRINFYGKDFEIRFVDKSVLPHNNALISFRTQEILVREDIHWQEIQVSIYHELTHGVSIEFAADDLSEEEVIYLSRGQWGVLKDNPELVEMLFAQEGGRVYEAIGGTYPGALRFEEVPELVKLAHADDDDEEPDPV